VCPQKGSCQSQPYKPLTKWVDAVDLINPFPISPLFGIIPVSFILDALPALLSGALITLQLTAISVLLGLVGGTLLGITRLSTIKPLSIATRVLY
jgi:ABC-type amino acid transport system permease subunit